MVFIHFLMREMDYWGTQTSRLAYSRLSKDTYQPTATATSRVKASS